MRFKLGLVAGGALGYLWGTGKLSRYMKDAQDKLFSGGSTGSSGAMGSMGSSDSMGGSTHSSSRGTSSPVSGQAASTMSSTPPLGGTPDAFGDAAARSGMTGGRPAGA